MHEITIFKTWDEPLADMAVDLLKSEGINALKIGSGLRSVYPVTFDGLAEIEIRVSENERERALEILAVRFSGKNDPSKKNNIDE